MWNATYADLIKQYPNRVKYYKGDSFVINGQTITLPQSLINIQGHWCLEEPRNRTPEERQQEPDMERFLVPINVNARIKQAPLDGNPYTLFKKGRTAPTEKVVAGYHESVQAIKQVDHRDAVIQIRQKRNNDTKIELVDKNLQQEGYIDLSDYIEQLPEQDNPYAELLYRLTTVRTAFSLLRGLHTEYNLTHGDVKLENIMVKEDQGRLIFCFTDYEFSKSGNWITAFQGTPTYAAPEVCLPTIFSPENPHVLERDGKLYVSRMVDNFAAGVLLSFLVGIECDWIDRARNIQTYWNMVQTQPELLNGDQFYRDYTGVLKGGVNILDQEYPCDEAKDEVIDSLFKEMADALQLDDDFVDNNEEELMQIIRIIVHLTRFNPEYRISLEVAINQLDGIITTLHTRYRQAQQAACAHMAVEPDLVPPPDSDNQDMDIDMPGPAVAGAVPSLTGTSGW
jgi:thiamine kinase-like enzyme